MANLKQEIEQQRPFSSLEEELLLNLIRTADGVQRAGQRIMKAWGVTSTQYNVLRILRGASPEGLTCSAIGPRMIAADPDITRLMARLKNMKLVSQRRDTHDRRVVWNHITAEGLALLQQMDPTIGRYPRELFAVLSEKEQAEFVRLLELTRARTEESEFPPTCDGKLRSK